MQPEFFCCCCPQPDSHRRPQPTDLVVVGLGTLQLLRLHAQLLRLALQLLCLLAQVVLLGLQNSTCNVTSSAI